MRTITNDSYTQRVVLQSRSNRNLYWNLEDNHDTGDHYELARADRNSVVLFRANDYGFGDYVKLFFSAGAKRVTKRIEFVETALSQIPAAELQRNLEVSAETLRELLRPVEPAPLPSTLPALRQSTYDEFARGASSACS
jgi:hypothetical protein